MKGKRIFLLLITGIIILTGFFILKFSSFDFEGRLQLLNSQVIAKNHNHLSGMEDGIELTNEKEGSTAVAIYTYQGEVINPFKTPEEVLLESKEEKEDEKREEETEIVVSLPEKKEVKEVTIKTQKPKRVEIPSQVLKQIKYWSISGLLPQRETINNLVKPFLKGTGLCENELAILQYGSEFYLVKEGDFVEEYLVWKIENNRVLLVKDKKVYNLVMEGQGL